MCSPDSLGFLDLKAGLVMDVGAEIPRLRGRWCFLAPGPPPILRELSQALSKRLDHVNVLVLVLLGADWGKSPVEPFAGPLGQTAKCLWLGSFAARVTPRSSTNVATATTWY